MFKALIIAYYREKKVNFLNIFYRFSLNLYLRLLINLSLHIKMSMLKTY